MSCRLRIWLPDGSSTVRRWPAGTSTRDALAELGFRDAWLWSAGRPWPGTHLVQELGDGSDAFVLSESSSRASLRKPQVRRPAPISPIAAAGALSTLVALVLVAERPVAVVVGLWASLLVRELGMPVDRVRLACWLAWTIATWGLDAARGPAWIGLALGLALWPPPERRVVAASEASEPSETCTGCGWAGELVECSACGAHWHRACLKRERSARGCTACNG